MIRNNWSVITGGPCSGKTSTINLLKKRGYGVRGESARRYFRSQIKLGLTNEQIRANPQLLQDNITMLQIKSESKLDKNQHVFLDRALPDSLAYYSFLKLKIPDYLVRACQKSLYGQVFFLEALLFKNDPIRNESEKVSKILERHLWRSYIDLGFKPIKVPVMGKSERLDFILCRKTFRTHVHTTATDHGTHKF